MLQTILWSDIDYTLHDEMPDDYARTAFLAATKMIRGSTIVSFYEDVTDPEGETEKADIINMITQWMGNASARYKPLIDAVEKSKDGLMADVDTTSRNWFNDAPSAKNADASGEDLTHLSTYSKSVSSSGYGTPMQRLKELDDEILDIYGRWAREFIAAFSLGREY